MQILEAKKERLLLIILAAIQFTAVVDFLIIMPLGPQYMRVFGISPGQFGLIVSSYAISAGLSGLIMSFFLDRFDRKRAMVFLYVGFTIGTLLCGWANSYRWLVAARAVAGAFGGVAGALIMAIIGDVVPEQRRGAAMGMVMSSFSVASICGVPLGLVLATHIHWHVPFLALGGVSAIILLVLIKVMPSLRGHLAHAQEDGSFRRTITILTEGDHQIAFLFMACLTFTGFIIFPYISNYMVANVGLREKQLPYIYLSGGLCTFFSLNWIGKWADRAGKLRVFSIMSMLAVVPILLLTHLPRVPVAMAILISTLLMVCMSGRGVPAMAMMTGAIEPRYRGGFMSVNSSVQQFASGIAAFTSGQVMGQNSRGEITHFGIIGGLSVGFALLCIYLARFLKQPEKPEITPALLSVEG